MAELSNARTGEEVISIRFDLTTLFNTPVQFAIDDGDEDVIEQRTDDYHSAYAYWLPDSKRHSITLTERDPAEQLSLIVSCGPTTWVDDDAPTWIREASG